MPRKTQLDAFGVSALLMVQLLFSFNQVIIKIVNTGLQPIFFAGLRSLLALVFVAAWLWLRGRPPKLIWATVPAGVLIGCAFSAEFIFLFQALDLTTVGRTSVIFYSMPVWLAVMAHFGLPGERINRIKALGLALAFAGTVWAILDRSERGAGSLLGDLCALAAAVVAGTTGARRIRKVRISALSAPLSDGGSFRRAALPCKSRK